jgi:hypothetical protein
MKKRFTLGAANFPGNWGYGGDAVVLLANFDIATGEKFLQAGAQLFCELYSRILIYLSGYYVFI